MKDFYIEDFVGVFDGYFSPEYCDDLINYYEWCKKNNRTWNRADLETMRKDNSGSLNPTSLPINESIEFSNANGGPLLKHFNDVFWEECYKQYTNTFSILETHDNHTIFTYKIQKTERSGGYHIWHAENGEKVHLRRMGVYLLYLNDVEEGGETEFLYLSKRVQPKKGRLLIWPPNFPWTHRGNPPLSGEKYIMTGWLEYN